MAKSTEPRVSMLFPTLVGAGCVIAGVLIMIETFFYFGHQGTGSSTAAMVLGALLIGAPILVLMASHAVHARMALRRTMTAEASGPSRLASVPGADLRPYVEAEVRRQLSAASAAGQGEVPASAPSSGAAMADNVRSTGAGRAT